MGSFAKFVPHTLFRLGALNCAKFRGRKTILEKNLNQDPAETLLSLDLSRSRSLLLNFMHLKLKIQICLGVGRSDPTREPTLIWIRA